MASSWLIYSLSGSGVWLGVDSLAAGLPTVLLLPIGGVVADRCNRRSILIVANIAQGVLALWLPCFGGRALFLLQC